MEKGLMVQNAQQLAALRKETGIDDLGQQDIILPRMRLIQPTTPNKVGKPGEFSNNVTGLASPVIEAVIIHIAKGRVMWPEKYQADQDPLCASDDSIIPRDGCTEYGERCADCPMALWSKDKKGEDVPPACSMVYNYLCIDPEGKMPFALSLMRTSARTAKQLNTLLKMYGPTHVYAFTSEAVSNKSGEFFEWRVTDGGPVEDLPAYIDLVHQYAGQAVTTDTGENPPAPGEEEMPF
jgi:hypothetical protein